MKQKTIGEQYDSLFDVEKHLLKATVMRYIAYKISLNQSNLPCSNLNAIKQPPTFENLETVFGVQSP